MTYTLTLNPLIIIQVCALVQTGIMAILVGMAREAKPPTRQGAAALEFFKVLGFCGLGVLAVLFLDTGIAWLAGAWGYADWRFQLPSALLLAITGFEYLAAGLLKRGSWIQVTYIAGVATALLVFLHVLVPVEVVMGPMLEGFLPAMLGLLIGAGALVAAIEARRVALGQERHGSGTWDISRVMDRTFNKWTNLVIWVLAVVHGILLFSGYSLLAPWA